MSNKVGFCIVGCFFIIEGFLSLNGIKIYFKYSGWQYVSQNYSFFLIIIGIIFLYIAYKSPRRNKITYCRHTRQKTKKTKPNQKQPKNPNPNKKLNIKQKDIKNIKRVIPKKTQTKGRHE